MTGQAIIGLFATSENVAEIVDSSSGSRPVADARRFVLRLPHLTDDRDVAQLQQAVARPAGGHPRSPEGRACVAGFAAANSTAKPTP